MNQPWYIRLLWWACDRINHPFIGNEWLINGQYHRECRLCKRIISEDIK
jgi:hypothetical protein